MAAPVIHPQLSTVSRRYGRYEFDRFDHLVSQHASLGAASIGKVHVDCRFLFRKSRWGTLDGSDPAGIIYLDLDFNQPVGYRLRGATVKVTLDDEDEELCRHFGAPTPAAADRRPVQIVGYGPRQMTGEPRYETVTTRHSLMPSFEAGGIVGAGGVGRDSEKTLVRECRWIFSSHLTTDEPRRHRLRRGRRTWACKVLEWQLTENELERQPVHSNVVHTAFSFVHGGQPFFIRVDVQGRLEGVWDEVRNRARRVRFPSTGGHGGGHGLSHKPQSARHATTLVNFDGHGARFGAPLDHLVHDLELAMELENMSPPIQVKTSQPVRFYEDGARPAPTVHANDDGRPVETDPSPPAQPRILEEEAEEEEEEGLNEHKIPAAPTVSTVTQLAALSARLLVPFATAPIPPPTTRAAGTESSVAPVPPPPNAATSSPARPSRGSAVNPASEEEGGGSSSSLPSGNGQPRGPDGRRGRKSTTTTAAAAAVAVAVASTPSQIQRRGLPTGERAELVTIIRLLEIWFVQVVMDLLDGWRK